MRTGDGSSAEHYIGLSRLNCRHGSRTSHPVVPSRHGVSTRGPTPPIPPPQRCRAAERKLVSTTPVFGAGRRDPRGCRADVCRRVPRSALALARRENGVETVCSRADVELLSRTGLEG